MYRTLLLAALVLAILTMDVSTSRGRPFDRPSRPAGTDGECRGSKSRCDITCNSVCNCTSPPYTLPPVPTCPAPPKSPSPPPCPSCPSSISSTTPSTPLKLPPGYAVQSRIIYKFFGCNMSETWDVANETCIKDGGYLAIPKTMSEVYVLIGMLMTHPGLNDVCAVHVGFHDKDKDGRFHSVLGQPMNEFSIAKWGRGQPDGEEYCVILDRHGFFFDEDCDEDNAFACELNSE